MFTWTVPSSFGSARMSRRRHLEVRVPLEAARGDDVPQEVDHPLALRRHLHLRDRVVEQVAPVLGVRRAEVVDRALAEQLHREQPRVGVGEHLRDVREVGDALPVEDPPVGVGDRLVEGVLADADRGEPEVELADVDGVERGVEGGAAGVQDVGFRHRVVVQAELADVHLRGDDVLHELVGRVPAVRREEDVALGPLHVGAAPEHGDHAGEVAVADVVLAAVRAEAALAVGGQHHVGGVDVGAVLALGEAEGEDRPVVEQVRGAASRDGVPALPDRSETEDRDLPRVPVREPVEGRDLVERADPRGVPALVRIPGRLGGRRQERGEDAARARRTRGSPRTRCDRARAP